MHHEPHPLAGLTVKLAGTAGDPSGGEVLPGVEYRLEDWWDRIVGKSWMSCDGNPAALKYAMRAGLVQLPTDDDVVYGKIDGLGHLVHVTELAADGAP